MESESVDLIYLDPPFNSGRAYNVIYPEDLGQVRAFDDTWIWTPECDAIIERDGPGMDMLRALVDGMGRTHTAAYLVMMTPRLAELHRLLKPTGSIYLHCDPTASHYLKVIMDGIFGHRHFRNEIVWSYRRWPARQKNFQRMHDVILRYAKGEDVIWNQLYEPLAESTIQTWGTKQQIADFSTGRRKPSQTDNESPGSPMRTVWDIGIIAPRAKERLGYKTQKPLALLERIVRASSNPGDVVLDPFCGCGTSIHMAENLNRNWIGIDITYAAIGAIQERFRRSRKDIWQDINIQGKPTTVREVNEKLLNGGGIYARKEFEKFCVATIGGLPNDKMGADGGIDGQIPLRHNRRAIVSVKSGNNVNVEMVRSLRGLLNEKQVAGVFITKQQPTKPMIDFANTSGNCEPGSGDMFDIEPFPRIQILTLEKILRGVKPNLPYASWAPAPVAPSPVLRGAPNT